MENKDQNPLNYSGGLEGSPLSVGTVHEAPAEINSLSAETEGVVLDTQIPKTESQVGRFLGFARRMDVILAVLLILGSAGMYFTLAHIHSHKNQANTSGANSYTDIKIPLNPIVSGKNLSIAGASNVIINGQLQLNDSLTVTPSLQPTGAKPGQIYFDQTTDQLAYYNGSTFVFLTGTPASGLQSLNSVQSVGGSNGQITLGNGLSMAANQLSNSGVLSVQGQNGNVTLTAGPGIVINGTNFSNSGVLSVASGSPNLSVANDGNGNVTLTVAPAGTGTVKSSGGTAGSIPLFTSAQNIENSIVTQSGLTVTISGDLSVVTGGLSLSNALTVSNGGTGENSLAGNGVLVGQGTAPITSVATSTAGLCLLSTAGAPVWAACPTGSGVTSLNSLTGALNIANASAAGTTITIDNASTTNKGIASFNGTNFTATSGAINTIQDINTGATPTFAGLDTNIITPSAAFTVGATGQAFTLQGSAASVLTATSGANTTTLGFVTPTANVTYRLQTATAGTYDICTTAGNCAAANAVTSPGGTVNTLAKFTGSQIIGNSIITDNGSTVGIGGALTVSGSSTFTGQITTNGGITATGALSISAGGAGALTAGTSGQQLILQGNGSTQMVVTSGANATTITFQAPTANVTYRYPTATAGTYDICTTAGNCAGSGGGVTTSGGATNAIPKFTGSQTIGSSSITDDGTNVTTSENAIIQGGTLSLGTAAAKTGTINFNSSTSSFVGTLVQGSLTAGRTYTLPDVSGTICTSAGNCSGAGSSNTLQAAYDAGNTIATSTGRDIAFTLSNTATPSNFTVTIASGSTSTAQIVRASGSGTADPSQLLLLSNQDTVRSVPAGLKIQSAAGGITTAIDLTDAGIGTAVNVGAHNIAGTTGGLSFTNFAIAGASGNITTNGTINGQTISNAASFTGSLSVSGATTLGGNLAVNGGNITSTGILNITPSGTLTVGVTGQQLVLQGSANTTLSATGGGFTTTVGFTGVPAGNVTYNFDRTPAAGSYTICTSIGNCASSGGGVTTSGGTTGTLPVFTGSQTLGNSLLSQSGSTVTVNGNLNLVSGNTFQVNGTQISSANLSNDANLAKLSASQTFTGNTIAFQNAVNSTNAFNIQNAGGNRIVTVDSTNGQVILGTASTFNGKLVFNNVSNANTVTIVPGTLTGSRTLTLPDASGTICTDSGNCAGAGATLQTGYNFSVGGTTPKIKVNSSLLGVDIQDANTSINADLFDVRGSNAAGLGPVMFGVGSTGIVTLENLSNSTSAFRLLTSGGTSVLAGDTTNGQILLGQSGTLNGTLIFNNATNANTVTLNAPTATASQTITLPNASGTICLNSGNCSGAGSSNTLQAAYDAGNTITTSDARDVSFTLADTTTDSNFLVNLQCTIGCGSNGRFAIQGNGTDVFTVSPNGGAVKFQNTTNSGNAFQIKNATGSGVFDADTTNKRIGINNGAPAYPLDVTGDINISAGSSYRINGTAICTSSGCTASSASAILNGTSTQAANFNVQAASSGTIAGVLQANAAGTADILNLRNGSGTNVATFSNTGTITLQNSTNGYQAFRILNAAGLASLTVSTMNGQTTLGNITTVSGSGVAGTLTFADGTNDNFSATLGTNTLTGYRNINLPDANGTVCLQTSTSCGFAPTSGSANYIQNGTATQSANFNVQAATSGSVAAVLQANAAGTGDIMDLKNGAGTAVATFSSTGAVLVKNSTDSTNAFQVQNAASSAVLNVGTSNSLVSINGDLNFNGLQPAATTGSGTAAANWFLTSGAGGNTTGTTGQTAGNGSTIYITGGAGGTAPAGSTNGSGGNVIISGGATGAGAGSAGFHGNVILQQSSGVVGVGTISPNQAYKLDVAGDINVSSGSAYRINGTAICTGAGCTAASGSGYYIQNQYSAVQTANLRIQTASDTVNTVTLQSSANQNNGTNQSDLLEFQNSSGTLVAGVTPNGTIWSAPVSSLAGVPTTARMFIQANSATSNSVVIRASASGTGVSSDGAPLRVQNKDGTLDTFTVGGDGAVTSRSITNSATAFQIQNASGTDALNVNTTNGNISTYGGSLNVNGIANPSSPTLTTSTTGGTLAAATYSYLVAATNQAGSQTVATLATPSSLTTTGSTSTNTLTWSAVANASGYVIYRTTNGGTTWYSNSVSSATTSITDNGTNFTWTTTSNPNRDYNATGGINVQSGTAITLDGGAGNYASSLAYDPSYNYVALNNMNSGGGIYLQSNSFLAYRNTTTYATLFNVNSTGQTTFTTASNTTAAFQVNNSSNNTVFDTDTTNGRVGINNATPSRTLDVTTNTSVTNAPSIRLLQSGSGDASMEFQSTAAATSFYVGQDTTDGSFKINSSTAASGNGISYVQSLGNSTGNTAATTLTQAVTATTGNTLVVFASWGTATSGLTCSDTLGNTWVTVVTKVDSTHSQSSGVCYATNVTGGSDTVTATFASSPYRRIVVSEYHGLATSSPVDVSASNTAANATTATDAVTSGTATTTTAGDLIYGAVEDDVSTNNVAAGTGYTSRFTMDGVDTMIQDKIQYFAASTASTNTFSNTDGYTALMVAFKAQPGVLSDTFSNPEFSLTQSGAASFKNYANSTTAFNIQNNASQQMFNVDTTNSIITLNGGTSSVLNNWATTSSLNTAYSFGGYAAANGYLYAVGGYGSGYQATVQYAKLNADGSVGTWNTTTALPGARGYVSAAVWDGYLYAVGGTTGAANQSTIYFARLNPDGTVGTWNVTTALPATLDAEMVAISNGYMYVLGGNNGTSTVTTVYRATMHGDGGVGSFATDTALPASLSQSGVVVDNGNIYLIGGYNGTSTVNTTYYASLNSSNGSVGTWNTGTALPSAMSAFPATAMNGNIYYFAGSNTYYAPINASGSLGNWTASNYTIPNGYNGQGAASVDGYMYVIGGYNGSGQTQVVYASGPRTYVGGSLDLVGLYGAQSLVGDNMQTTGSVGGTLTAGNTTVVGTLQVQSQASFNSSVAVNDGLNVSINSGLGYIAQLQNTNTGTSAKGLLIQLAIANASRSTSNYFEAFAGPGSTVAGKIQGGASAVAYTTSGADYAEYFLANPNNLPQPGELVALDGGNDKTVTKATSGTGQLMGVVSTSPGFIGNGPICNAYDDHCDSDYQKYNVLVAMTGQVPVKVSVANGAIHRGDAITASSTAGVGQKATAAGTIVGYAEQDTTTDGTIQVLIQPGYYSPAADLQGSSNVTNFTDINVSGTAQINDLKVTGTASLAQLTVSGNATVSGTLTVGGTLILSSMGTAPTNATNGAMYYDTAKHSIMCYQNGAWVSCSNGLRYTNTTAPAAISNTSSEAVFGKQYTLPVGDCVQGRVYRVTAMGYYSTDTSATSLGFKMRLGGSSGSLNGTILASGSAAAMPAGASNLAWRLDAQFTCDNNPSTSAGIEAQGLLTYVTPSGQSDVIGLVNTNNVTMDTSDADNPSGMPLQLSAQWGTASGANSITLRQLVVESLGP